MARSGLPGLQARFPALPWSKDHDHTLIIQIFIPMIAFSQGIPYIYINKKFEEINKSWFLQVSSMSPSRSFNGSYSCIHRRQVVHFHLQEP